MKLDYTSFLDDLTSKLIDLRLDITGAKLDHVAYQTATKEEYDVVKPKFEEFAELIREPLVGGRRVGVFKFKEPQQYKDQIFEAIELIEPKEGQTPKSGLEHAEFLLPVTLEEYIHKYPNINWNTDAINRREFPMLILKLSEEMRVKFPRYPIL